MSYDYDALYARTPDALGAPTRAFVDFFDGYDRPNVRVLDIGCGQGRDALFIARLGPDELAASALAVALFGLVLWSLPSLTGAVAPIMAAELGARGPALRPVLRPVLRLPRRLPSLRWVRLQRALRARLSSGESGCQASSRRSCRSDQVWVRRMG